MGAPAPVSPWIPEDDLLLKNAVEAGASLESLAKGAVQFSQRFTVRELQDRWYSLLYDPAVSAEAAFRMNEFEHSESTIPPKFIRAGNSKENKCVLGKRKAESVCSCYHALRKRICNEPFNSMDLSFLVTPNDDDHVGDEYEHLSGQCLLGDPVSNQYELQESNLDVMHHSFPQIVDAGTAYALDTQFQNTVQEDYPMEHDNIHEDTPHILGENTPHTENRSVVEEFGQPKELPVNDDPVHGCSKFDGNDALSWPVSECDSPFHNLEYASPLPEMPIWRMDEVISVPCIPENLGACEKDMHHGDTFPLLADGDIKNACSTEYDDVRKDSELKTEITSDEPQNAPHSTEDFLAELSNYLSNDEEEPRVDVDGKALMDQSYYECLNTILLSSPNNFNQNNILNISGQESSITSHRLQNHSGACPGDMLENRGSPYSVNTVCDSEIQLPSSTSALDPHPEVKDGIIWCVLNTEDTEIPFNDHIVFPTHWHPGSASPEEQRSSQDAGRGNYLSSKELLSNKKSTGIPVMGQRDLENTEQSRTSSQIARSQMMPEAVLLPRVGDRSIKFELPGTDSSHKSVGFACGGSTRFNSSNADLETLVPDKLEEETTETALAKHLSQNSADSILEKPVFGSDCYKHPQTNACAVKQVEDAPARIQNHQALHARMGSTDIAASKQLENHSMSYPVEPPKESDAYVPYFSDVEAMILDMDLDPEGQDLCCNEEVSRYQHEDTKKTIMRLEQGAHSYMQRAIASHGAFAVIYGRHSKHYIRKSEVLLGRATEDVAVDIDLGREGRANKISRRQATINLDKSGSFSLKNLGKSAISVNDKEIAPGQSLSLASSCLIEIRGMPFIFEANQTCVKRYLDSIAQNNRTQEHL